MHNMEKNINEEDSHSNWNGQDTCLWRSVPGIVAMIFKVRTRRGITIMGMREWTRTPFCGLPYISRDLLTWPGRQLKMRENKNKWIFYSRYNSWTY